MAKEPVITVPEVVVPKPLTEPAAAPVNIMNQKDSIGSKKADGITDDIIKSFSQTVSKLEEVINKLITPTAPVTPIIPEAPKVQKSFYQEIDEKLTRWMES